ncbi:MAG: hypothetical protein ACRCVT_04540 [Leadbetterella sp.]
MYPKSNLGRYIALAVLFVQIGAVAQKKVMSNTITQKHQYFKGTKYAMVLPSGFEKATFKGFSHKETGSYISFNHFNTSLDIFTKECTFEKFREKGMVLQKEEDVMYIDQPAKLYSLLQIINGKNFNKYILVIEENGNVETVSAVYPEDKPMMQKDVLAAILSTSFQKIKTISPEEDADYSINSSSVDYKFAGSVSGSLIYTQDGNLPTSKEDKTTFSLVASSPNVLILNRKDFAKVRFELLPRGDKYSIKDMEEIEVNGFSGYEITGKGTNENGRSTLVYMTILYTTNSYYQFVGLSAEKQEESLKNFKRLTKTFTQNKSPF